jgi:UDP-MurNAc hydroxylase
LGNQREGQRPAGDQKPWISSEGGRRLRVTYFGQACTLIDVGGVQILTDPWLTEGAYFGTWHHTHILAEAGVTPETIPKDVDFIFLSHEHEDHLDPATLRHFRPDIPVLVCRFPTNKFRHHLESLGLTNIRELPSGEAVELAPGVKATIFGTAEYTNDAALFVEGDGCTVFNETDCKLGFADLQRLGARGIDIGFYMFSGANWYPMMYDYPEDQKRALTRRRRQSLLRSLVQRVKLTRPRVAVPAAGPCTVLDPDLLWLNSEDQGIFVDPEEAVRALAAADTGAQPLYMAATDVWDSATGFEPHAPSGFRVPRTEYLQRAAERYATRIRDMRSVEPPAGADLGERLVTYFNEAVRAQTPEVRKRIDARLAVVATGPNGGAWTVDFRAPGPDFVRQGEATDWTYRLVAEDKLLYPFMTGEMPFFEDLLLSLRVQVARRPDAYNEPLYHFLYEPDPEKLHNWYATH